MVRKRRTDASGSGESSEYQETSGSTERTGPQRGPAPQQQGGGRERGWVASGFQQAQQGGRGGGGYYQGRGSHPQPRDAEQPFAPSQYQGRGGHQFRGGMPYQQQYGGRRGGRSTAGGRGFGPSAAGSTRPQVPELHQATQAPYQPTQPGPVQASSSRQSEMSTSEVVEQFQQLSVEGESSSQEMQPIVPPVSSSKSVRFPIRPGKGTNGVRCVVKANHFFAELPDKDLHQYDVSITPEVTSRGVNRAVMEQLVKLYRESYLGGRLPAYDGRKSLYTAGPLPFTLRDFQIVLVDDDDGSGTERRQRTFRVVIKLAARVDLHHLGMFLAGRQADAPQEALQVLDIVLRELPTARYLPVGRSFYSPDLGRRQQLGEGLESWRGFYQSIRPTQMGLSLNIDMSSTAFIEPLPVIEFVIELLNRDVQARPLSDADRVKIKKALRGVKVEVTHRGNMRRKYRISGLTSQATRELTFPVDERGTVKSVVQYFQETYGFTIQHTNWPCLQVGNQQRPNYLPMEVCKIVEGQRYSKRLNERQITALLKVTCQRPHDRELDILQTVHPFLSLHKMAFASFSTATPTLFKLDAGSSAALASSLPPRPSLLGFQRWRRASGIVRAEEKAKNSAFPSSPMPGNDRGDYEELTNGSGDCDPLCSLNEVSSRDFEESYQPKTDLLKALSILATTLAGAAAINHSWVASNQDLAMVLVFSIGYAGIIFEESLAFNKSGVGLLMAVCLWVIRSIGAPSTEIAVSELNHASGEVSEIVFFLLGAMTIVEIVDAHRGFKLITDSITTRKPRTLLWVVGFVTFFVSSVLDNLTSTIIMVSLLRKLVPPSEYRKLLGAVIVIAANAGGAWTPIGDVTTTMLWINGQISTLHTMQDLFVPSAISLAVPLALMSLTSEVSGSSEKGANILASEKMAPRGQLVFSVGIGALLFVPVFKAITGLPPYIGMLLGLGVLWILTDAIHFGNNGRQKLKVPQALSRIDTQGVLFFLGILLSVSSLESAGVLRNLANYLDAHIPNVELIASAIGVVSAIIDNVPLVAATMGMYNLTSFPQDSEFWQLVAFCAGTGGSMLIIGSAAGVAYMGMEKVNFFWYLRKVSGFAFAGYAAGIVAYLAAHNLHLSLPTSLAELPFLSGF